ncbi:MAG: LacI family DNA-binding transcriptional regulator [Neisseria sp.]|uniref:LacI family DNA-binding transcriptional regulator n=1 Tax=Neisseria sp. TaxID=192066 RepID=UPI0026DBE70C|nr:LacI family DNA-binding transcriptional regulator [Neisseria sp.]MDO4640284.1 LacI family DNA-binding transcriptional regulator [Neisseria sp.]
MATIYDVARLAGVSPKTVSRVLNNDAPVKEVTRREVEKAIAQLGYVPSSAARTMRSHRSGLIGVITGAVSHVSEEAEERGLPDMFLVQGAQQVVAETGKTLIIADTGDKADRVSDLIRTFMQYRVEGVLYVAEHHQRVDLTGLHADFPLVLLNCFDDEGTPAVVPDDEAGQYELTKKIIASGHRRIGYLTLPENIVATRLRLNGYKAALAEAGIAYDERLVVTGYTDRSNRSSDLLCAINKILNQTQQPTVLCCGNDEMALRVYGMLRTRGIKVPEDISVAGYDNYRLVTETLFPPLSSAELPYTQMGRQAAQMLLQMIEGKELPPVNPVRVSGAVFWRDSVLGH